MYEEPVCNYDIENGIAYDNPDWNDRSLVNLTWDGLVFPTKPAVVLASPI
jgi:hypothetical protein